MSYLCGWIEIVSEEKTPEGMQSLWMNRKGKKCSFEFGVLHLSYVQVEGPIYCSINQRNL